MKKLRAHPLPLEPLLHAYLRRGLPTLSDLYQLPGLGPRFAAVSSATVKFLYSDFLDRASSEEISEALQGFYESCVQPPLHAETLRRRIGLIRHGLSYLLRGRDPLPSKAAAFLASGGIYRVNGLGPRFWSALLQALRPERNPGWTPAILTGLKRLGLATWPRGAGTEVIYSVLQSAYTQIQDSAPELSAQHIDHFLTLVAAMTGRSLPNNEALIEESGLPSFESAIARERSRQPLRERLKERGQALAHGQEQMELGLGNCDGKEIGNALVVADIDGCGHSPLDWGAHADTLTLWAGRLWGSDDPYATLSSFWNTSPLPRAGLWLPAAILHLRDPQQFAPWNDTIRSSYAKIDDSDDGDGPPAERYRLFNEGVAWLRQRYSLHPLEIPAVLSALEPDSKETQNTSFSGFCADTFHFLGELVHNNRREWMERHRSRYRFAVREPLLDLCRTVGSTYIEPVLRGVYGWSLDTEPRNGRALTSICKNTYGKSQPYNTVLWIVFCRRTPDAPRKDAQFFVRLDGEGLRFGLRLDGKARSLLAHFRAQIRRHAELVFRTMCEPSTLKEYRFLNADGKVPPKAIETPDDLRTWSEGRSVEISQTISAEEALSLGEELAGMIAVSFDRLLPLYACAVEADAQPRLLRFLNATDENERYSESDFERATLLGREWIERARGLLNMKGQLILQGVPGTGKTFVARHLARLLTGGSEDRIRLVQFHPAYTYEEFVEGIRVRSETVNGSSNVTYPVEPGLLCAFAEEARRHPSRPHVLLIDEINRGNLPRIFGELLYLLEYREQSVCLPCSRRSFRLPTNLYLVATMNAADRSIAHLDKALRRRFSFLDMPPDPSVLTRWLHLHPPVNGTPFADRMRMAFERLNARLRADLGPQTQIGHSYFMVSDLDEERLRLIWQHHVRPLLEEHFAGQPAKLETYNLESIFEQASPRRERVCAV
jgi:5-methylcytosine-specific restriction protein B